MKTNNEYIEIKVREHDLWAFSQIIDSSNSSALDIINRLKTQSRPDWRMDAVELKQALDINALCDNIIDQIISDRQSLGVLKFCKGEES